MRRFLLERTFLVALLASLAAPRAMTAVTITIVPPAGMGELPADSDTRKAAERLLGPQLEFKQNALVGFYVFSAADWNAQIGDEERSRLLMTLQDYWGKDRVSIQIDKKQEEPVGLHRDPRFPGQIVIPVEIVDASALFDGKATGLKSAPETVVSVAKSLPLPTEPSAAPSGPYTPEMLQAAAEATGTTAADLRAIIRTKEWSYHRLETGNLMGLYDRYSALKAAKALGLDVGRRGEKLAALIKDPSTNIRIGAWLWASLLKSFGGNADRALMAWYLGRPAYTPAWRSIARDPQMRTILAAFHRFRGTQDEMPPLPKAAPRREPKLIPAPKTPEWPSRPQLPPRPTPVAPPTLLPPGIPAPIPPLSVPTDEPLRPQGRYWTQGDVDAWLSYYNENEVRRNPRTNSNERLFGWNADFLRFVKAMIFTESPVWFGGVLYADSQAQSLTGPRGLAQFTWDTAHFYHLIETGRDATGRRISLDYRFDGARSIRACMLYVRDLAAANRGRDYITLMNRVANGYNVGEGQYYVQQVHRQYCAFGGEAACYNRRPAY